MVEFNAVNSNLLYDNNINFSNPTPIKDIYPRAYGQRDEFVPSEKQAKKPSFMGSFLKTTAGAFVLWLAGRKGLFGKGVKNWLHGLISEKKFNKIVNERMTEYLDKLGLKVKNSEIVKGQDANGNPTHLFKAVLSDGTVKEYSISEGLDGKFFKLKGKRIENSGSNNIFSKIFGKGSSSTEIEEYIVFERKNGAVVSRTDLKRANDNTVKAYAHYRGENVLNKDYNEVTDICKDYSHKGPFRRFLIAGSKTETATVRNFGGGQKIISKHKRIRNKSGVTTKSVHENANGKVVRTYGEDQNGKRIIVSTKEKNKA